MSEKTLLGLIKKIRLNKKEFHKCKEAIDLMPVNINLSIIANALSDTLKMMVKTYLC